jgi:hypothetical protein
MLARRLVLMKLLPNFRQTTHHLVCFLAHVRIRQTPDGCHFLVRQVALLHSGQGAGKCSSVSVLLQGSPVFGATAGPEVFALGTRS